MNRHPPYFDRPRTLVQRLRQLNENLLSLGQRLRESIASVIGETVAETVRDGLRRLFGRHDAAPAPSPAPPTFHRRYEDRDPLWDDPEEEERDDGWREQEDEPEPEPFRPPAAPQEKECSRWRHALGASLRAACWWLERQKPRRPVVTTAVIAIAAGVTAFVAGPAVADGLHLVSSMFGLLATADVASSTAQHLAGFVGG
jgi:hypothetical protein